MAGYIPTPIATDAYSRFMAEMYDDRSLIAVPTGFQQFFVGGKVLYATDANDVDIDIIRGTELTAALVPRGTVSRPLGNTQRNAKVQRYSTFSRSFPLIEEESDIDANQLLNRLAGENQYNGVDRMSRLRSHALDLHQEHVRRIVRLQEILAAQAIQTGQHVAILGTTDTDLIYDFRRAAGNTIVATGVWTAGAATILADIDRAWNAVNTSGHVGIDMMITGASVTPGVLGNTQILALADNMRVNFLQFSPNYPVPQRFQKFVDGGMTPLGSITSLNGHTVYWFTYEATYTNAAGAVTPYMPLTETLFAYSGARCDRYMGPPERLPVTASERAWYQEMFGFAMDGGPMPQNVKGSGAVLPGAYYFDAYPASDRKRVTLRSQAAPIMAPVQTDAFCRMTGCA